MKPRYREPGFAGAIRTAIRALADVFGAYRAMPNLTQLADGSTWLKVHDGVSAPVARVTLPADSEFLADPEAREVRTDIAFALMEPDVHGFMLFTLRRQDDGDTALTFHCQTKNAWLPAFTAGFARVVEGMGGMVAS